MLRSMTGFGKVEKEGEGVRITGEVKSLNNRYLEVAVKLPKADYLLEQKLREVVKRYVRRGKVDVSLRWEKHFQAAAEPHINEAALRQYLVAGRTLQEEFGLQGGLSLEYVLSLKEIFAVEENNAPPDEGLLIDTCEQLMEVLTAEKAREGALIAADFEVRLARVLENLRLIEERWPLTAAAHEQRLRDRLAEVSRGSGIDEPRLLQELALFMERLDITEEILRLTGHTEHFRDLLSSTEALGRKLDFLIQEMVREANTIGSKSQDLFAGERVVEIKVEIEKLREQVQNVE
jgi:uncharacterized protein (TIGR00255 family)